MEGEQRLADQAVDDTELADLVLGVRARRRRLGRAARADVAQRAEPFDDLVRGPRAALRPAVALALQLLREGAAHRVDLLRPLAREVAPLAGVLAQVVELGARRLHVLEAPLADHAQVAPAELQQRHEGLGVGGGLLRLGATPKRRGQAPARERALGRGQPGELEHGREEIDEPYRALEAASLRNPRRAHQERHVQRRLIGEEAVQALLVLAEPFAVVGEDDERRVVAEPERAERVLEAAEELVGPRHLAVVGTPCVAGGVGLGRLVGIVRLVEVKPEEDSLARLAVEPRDGLRDRGLAPLLDGVQELRVAARALEAIGVDVEAAVEAGLRVEHDRRDEGAGREPACAEQLGQERHLRHERGRDVVADPVLRRQQAGEDRDVGRTRERHVGRSLDGERPRGRDAVEPGGRHVARPVTAEPVGAQRVDRHDHDMTGDARRGGRALARDEDRQRHGGA